MRESYDFSKGRSNPYAKRLEWLRFAPRDGATPPNAGAAYRLGVGLALAATLLIVWLNVAAGLLGIEDDDPANLLYVGVLAIAFGGAIAARLRPRGLAWVSFATALAQALVGAFALSYPNTASPVQILLLHGLLVGLFAGAGLCFRYAWRSRLAE